MTAKDAKGQQRARLIRDARSKSQKATSSPRRGNCGKCGGRRIHK